MLNMKSEKREVKVIRKQFTRDIIPKETLDYWYTEKSLPIQKIADMFGKHRVRIWQLLTGYGIHNKSRVVRECLNCGKSFQVVRSRVREGGGKYCQDKCYYEHKQSLGYDPSRQGQRIGRKVIEAYLGLTLPIGFIVHHEDGDQSHNEIENLWVFPDNSSHVSYHHAKRNGNGMLPYAKLWELPGKIEEWVDC